MKKSYLVFIFLFLAVGFFLWFFSFDKKNIFIQKELEKKEAVGENLLEEKKIQEILKFGFMTDAHCYADFDKVENEWVLNWRCKEPLEKFIHKMNGDFLPDFVLEGGDLTDGKDKRTTGTFVDAKAIFDQSDAPFYHVLGNHETRSFSKEEWRKITGYDKNYYYFDAKGYRMIVLDGNNKPSGDGSVDTSYEERYYPGLIDSDQMKWLKDLLENSKDYEKIVFVHQPTFPTDAKKQNGLFVDGEILRKMFSQNKVRAVFSGHVERMCYLVEDGVNYYVLQGFWKANGGLKEEYRFKDGGVFSEVTVNSGDVEVKVYHRERQSSGYFIDKSFVMTPENSNCFNGSTLISKEEKTQESAENEAEEAVEEEG